jgi:CheY-like chemotaxis protein
MKSILILEDESHIATRLHAVLAPLGYELLHAATADEAIQQFEANASRIDLLIADVHIPLGPSGVRVALPLRSSRPGLRVILTSGYPPSLWSDQDAADVKALCPDSVVILKKPFPAADLVNSVDRLIGPALAATPTAHSN